MFKRAERKQAKLRLALDGPSGSGKTHSALVVARGIVGPRGKIAVIDTERSSASLYADLAGGFDVCDLEPPYTPQRYIDALRAAEDAGYDLVIADSLSHAWSGEGGVLDMQAAAAKASRSGNGYTAWRDVTPQHNALVNALLGARSHIIATLRTKTAYEMQDENGKKKPVKVGLAPIQRDGMEYEFTVVLDLSIDGHIATPSKDRTGLFDGQHFVCSLKTGEALRAWLDGGAAEPEPRRKEDAPRASTSATSVPDELAALMLDELAALAVDEPEKIKAWCERARGANDKKPVLLAAFNERCKKWGIAPGKAARGEIVRVAA